MCIGNPSFNSILVSRKRKWHSAAKYCKDKFRGSLQVVRNAEQQVAVGKMLAEADGGKSKLFTYLFVFMPKQHYTANTQKSRN